MGATGGTLTALNMHQSMQILWRNIDARRLIGNSWDLYELFQKGKFTIHRSAAGRTKSAIYILLLLINIQLIFVNYVN